MASFMDKIGKSLFGSDDEFEDQGIITPDEPEFETIGASNKKNKVVNIHTTAQLKVVVIQPESFDDASEIADHLKSKKPVVVNLEKLDKDSARRAVDFISGAIYALDGSIQQVSKVIFLVAPYNVGIMANFKDELKNKGIFPWSY